MIVLRIHMATMVLAASYITLGFANPDKARDLWAVYATATLVLATVGIIDDLRRNRG